jgi:hypothetical protein
MLRTVDVFDISNPDQLIRYAVNAQLALVGPHFSHDAVGRATGIGGANLSRKLQTPEPGSPALEPTSFNADELRRLDEVIVAASRQGGRYPTGGLSSLAVRLRRQTDRASLTTHIPPGWTSDVLKAPSESEIGVLTQASALMSMFLAAESVDRRGSRRAVEAVHERYAAKLEQVVRQLILVGMAPPTPRNVEALIMLGNLANYSFNLMQSDLEDALTKSPLGFRVWRAYTKLVKLSKPAGPHLTALRSRVRTLLENSESFRRDSVYPGRSLDLELAIVVPPQWSPPDGDDYIGRLLLARANNQDATVRERGTAAMGLWQRAVEYDGDLDGVASSLGSMIAEFKKPSHRPDAHRGMQWVADVLEQVIEERAAVCNRWPTHNENWLRSVHEAANTIEDDEVPSHLVPGTKTLFKHALLQNAGVYRRQAIETLIAGGYTKPVSNALARYLELEQEEAWIRIRAIFALGFLQHRDIAVSRTLTAACQKACGYLTNETLDMPTKAQKMELHTALFAIGDCYGPEDVDQEIREKIRVGVTEALEPMLKGDKFYSDDGLYLAARAAAYMLTFTAMPRANKQNKDLSETLLEILRDRSGDPRTRTFAKWALDFRFDDETGKTRPLVAATNWF